MAIRRFDGHCRAMARHRADGWPLAAASAIGLCLLIGLAGCAGQQAPTGVSPTATPQAPGRPARPRTATPRPTQPPRPPAPAELQGRWQTVIAANDHPVLTIMDFSYSIQRLGIGTGAIDVRGDQIRFYG